MDQINIFINNTKADVIKNKTSNNHYFIQNINSIKINFDKSLIIYNDLYFFSINTKYKKTIKTNRRIKIVKLFIDVNNQKENFYICFYFN